MEGATRARAYATSNRETWAGAHVDRPARVRIPLSQSAARAILGQEKPATPKGSGFERGYVRDVSEASHR
jgi:hypothetical protein